MGVNNIQYTTNNLYHDQEIHKYKTHLKVKTCNARHKSTTPNYFKSSSPSSSSSSALSSFTRAILALRVVWLICTMSPSSSGTGSKPFHLLVHVDISQVFLNVHRSETVVITQLTFDTHTQVLPANMSTALGKLCC